MDFRSVLVPNWFGRDNHVGSGWSRAHEGTLYDGWVTIPISLSED